MTDAISTLTPRSRSLMGMAAVAASLVLAGGSAVAAQDERASVVATTEVLGSVVGQLVGDAAEVSVIMPSGANPHSYEPSARDAERILDADVVVSNGLELEESLLSILESAESEGAIWFEAADQVAVRDLDGEDPDHDEHADDAGETDLEHHEAADQDDAHDHGSEDPHIWTDSLAIRDVVIALESTLAEAGIDVGGDGAVLVADLEALHAEVESTLAAVPDDQRKLVTGHRSLGYFADRYGFELIGTVIPSLSTSGEPTAREMAQLIADIEANDVPAVFAEVGTPQSVAEAVASDSGAALVQLNVSQLPVDGTYQDLIRGIAVTVADALVE